MKKLLSAAVAVSLMFSSIVSFASETENELQKTAEYVYLNTQNPVAGSTGGEWAVFGLARSEYNVDSDYFLKYAENLQVGTDSTPEYLENPRFIFALTSIGMDASDFKGKNLYTPLLNTEKVISFGVNAASWALMALDCENYKTNGEEEKYISFILNSALADGGFAYSGKVGAEADVTAVVIQALAPYIDRSDVKTTIDGALSCLSEMQESDGGFISWGEESAESTIQVITALNTLGIPLDDERFVKAQSLFENLMMFSNGDGSFKHLVTDEKPSVMTTEQALYALSSIERAESGKDRLYDLSGVAKIKMPRFSDIEKSPYGAAIEILAEKGIINGVSDAEFNPYGNITREESAAMTARAARYAGVDTGATANDLTLAEKAYSDFDSVSDWAKDAVAFCYASGITAFEKEQCQPKKNRTREETAQMIYTVISI